MSSSSNKRIFHLVLGDQLFPLERVSFKKGDSVLMLEDHSLCTHFKYHKNKILFFLISMRRYRETLEKEGVQTFYYSAEHKLFKSSFFHKVDDFLSKNKNFNEVQIYEVADRFFSDGLKKYFANKKIKMTVLDNPMFLTSKAEFSQYLDVSKKPFMMTFYNRQRSRLNYLMDKKGNPEGGQWSFDKENRKKYPKNINIPPTLAKGGGSHFRDVEKTVNKHFSDHPGDCENFWLPTDRQESLEWLDHFVEFKFENFGPYEDAIKSNDAFGFHSVISPLLNNGLILPDELVETLIKKAKRKKIPIASVEGYVRQVIGWREFVKGIYDNFEKEMEERNFWNHKNKLTSSWYEGTTGIPPLDDSIMKARTFGYTHHIERLMILSNMMLLSEIHPKEVHRWFMEMYVDSADWVMAANVYGMGQMSEGGIFATKPYICGSNYILKMSDYKKGDWCDVMDGLYWRFVDKNRSFFSKNPRMSMMAKMLDKIDPKRKKKLFLAAEEFIEKHTV